MGAAVAGSPTVLDTKDLKTVGVLSAFQIRVGEANDQRRGFPRRSDMEERRIETNGMAAAGE
jgi:hypothetical protein